MAIYRRDDTTINALGTAISGVRMYVLTQPANTTTLTPLATIYSDLAGDVVTQPLYSDGLGHIVSYLSNAQLYTIVWIFPNGNKQVYPDQGPPDGGLVGGTPKTDNLTTQINGSTNSFTLSFIPISQSLQVVYNGSVQQMGLNYTLAGKVVTMAFSPQIGDSLEAFYSY